MNTGVPESCESSAVPSMCAAAWHNVQVTEAAAIRLKRAQNANKLCPTLIQNRLSVESKSVNLVVYDTCNLLSNGALPRALECAREALHSWRVSRPPGHKYIEDAEERVRKLERALA